VLSLLLRRIELRLSREVNKNLDKTMTTKLSDEALELLLQIAQEEEPTAPFAEWPEERKALGEQLLTHGFIQYLGVSGDPIFVTTLGQSVAALVDKQGKEIKKLNARIRALENNVGRLASSIGKLADGVALANLL
jgi:hypothetical protein